MKVSNYMLIMLSLVVFFLTSCSFCEEKVYLSYISYDDRNSESFPVNLNLKELPYIVLESEETKMIQTCATILNDIPIYPSMPREWADERVSKKVSSFIFVSEGKIILEADDLNPAEQYPLSITNYEMWRNTRDKLKQKLLEIKVMQKNDMQCCNSNKSLSKKRSSTPRE